MGVHAPPLSMVHLSEGSIEAPAVALSSAPPPLEPIESLDSGDRGGMGAPVSPSLESFGQVVPVGDEVMPSRTLPPIPGAFFAKKLCDFLASLEADELGSGKTIGCLLKEREIRRKTKKVGSCKEKPFKSKSKKIWASGKAHAVA